LAGFHPVNTFICYALSDTFVKGPVRWEDFVLSKTSRTLVAVAVVAGILLLAGCRTHTAIADINKDPSRFVGKDVTISGSASNSFSALGNGIFQVDDGTGQMWVYSQNFGVPGNGNVSVTGRVEQGFSFAGRSFGIVLRQTEAR